MASKACAVLLGINLVAAPATAWAAGASMSVPQATQLLQSFGLRVAACGADNPIPMSDIQVGPAVAQRGVAFQAKAIPVIPVRGRFVGTCKNNDGFRTDTFTIDGTFETGLYKDDFGSWKHTPVLRPQCEQVRTGYQVKGQPLSPAHDQSICDYTAPR